MISEVLSYLKKNKEASATEISLYLKIDKTLAEALIQELIRKGRVEKQIYEKVKCHCNQRNCSGNLCYDVEIYKIIETK